MSDLKHTPAPWKIERLEDIDLPNHVAISANTHTMLAQVVWKMEDDERSPQCEANAFLIAAAPDLLAALIEARSLLEESEQCYENQMFRNAQIDAAIHKAKGE